MTTYIVKKTRGDADDVDINSDDVDITAQPTYTVDDLFKRSYGPTIYPQDIYAKGPWVDVRAFGASGSSQQTTGSITAGEYELTLTDAKDFADGMGIRISGAGASGADLIAVVESGGGTTILTLATAASTTVTNVVVEHDDSSAIQAAENYLGDYPGTLYFPTSPANTTYRIGQQITVNGSYRTWTGGGSTQPILQCEFSGTMILVNSNATSGGGTRLYTTCFNNLFFQSADAVTATALELRDVTRASVEDCRFAGFKATTGALYLRPRDNIEISRCSFYANYYGIYCGSFLSYSLLGTGSAFQTWFIDNCHFSDQDAWAIYINCDWFDVDITRCSLAASAVGGIYVVTGVNVAGSCLRIEKCTFEQAATGYYIHVDDPNTKAVQKVKISDCGFYNASTHAILAERVDRLTIEDNNFRQTAAGGGTAWEWNSSCDYVLLKGNRYSSDTPTKTAGTEYVGLDGRELGGGWPNATDDAFVLYVEGDAYPRIKIRPNGQILLGQDGTTSPDVALYTDLSNQLKLTDRLALRDGQPLPTGATPSILGGNIFYTTNVGATSITDFSDDANGIIIVIVGNDSGNTTVTDTATINLAGGADFLLGNNDVIVLVRDPASTTWCEVCRSNN